MAQITRRDFMAGTAVATAALASPNILAHGLRQDKIKVGLIGCGGRGRGAATNALDADEGVVIWAMGDVFEDHLNSARQTLEQKDSDRMLVTDDRMFLGFDAYKAVIEQDVDYVILATPPGFRPEHFAAAIAGGKHVFMEKPVAVDAPGIRKVIRASMTARREGLAVVAGTQRRHQKTYLECIDRIHSGQIGDVVATYAYWNQGALWMKPRDESWSDLEWQLRNWLYFTWLSGDHIVEQHVHNLDACCWAKDAYPVKCMSLAGRQVRTLPAYGHIFDHFATEYEFEDGTKMQSQCRQIDGCKNRVAEHIVGTKGQSNAATRITGEKPWQFDGERPSPYMIEHRDLIASIRAADPLNEGILVAKSTLVAIMGRMSAYTGQEITWDQAFNSDETLMPPSDTLSFEMDLDVAEVAVPGRTQFV